MSAILRRLQGGNLEVFKVHTYLSRIHFRKDTPPPFIYPEPNPLTHLQFGMYVIFPIGWMYYFGTNLDDRFSVPGFWPSAEQSHKIPLEKEEIDRELARMRTVDAVRRERRLQREAMEAQAQAQVAARAENAE
jgi:protein PET100